MYDLLKLDRVTLGISTSEYGDRYLILVIGVSDNIIIMTFVYTVSFLYYSCCVQVGGSVNKL